MRHAFLEAARRRLAQPRAKLGNKMRPLAPILCERRLIWTLHLPLRGWQASEDGTQRIRMPIDGPVMITMPLIKAFRGGNWKVTRTVRL